MQGGTQQSRGADTGWLAQWPHEAEVVFPPFTALEVLSTRVEGATFCIMAKPSVNLKPLTIEQVIRKRQNLVSDMCEQLMLRVTHEVDEGDASSDGSEKAASQSAIAPG